MRILLNILLVGLAVGAGPGLAQTGAAADSDAEQRALERMTITGSRLLRAPMEGASPVTVIDREALMGSGLPTLGDYLQQLSFMSGSPLNTSSNERGSGGGLSRGISTVELRGLGPERTLVLLNGRRMVPGGNGASGVVDLNTIPVGWIERVEILKTGASVAYGADAVAGVVNVITRDVVDGLEVRLDTRVTDSGDARKMDLSTIWGFGFRDGSVIAGLDYYRQDALGKGERDFSSRLLTVEGPDNMVVSAGSSAPPGGHFRTSNGRLTLREGATGTTPDDFRPFIGSGPGNDRFNFNPFEDLVQDAERTSLFASGRYHPSSALSLFFEAQFQQRDSSQQLAALPLFTNRETDVVVAADNLFNPFGETIRDARRRLVEAGPRRFVQDSRTWRVVLGADGQAGAWFWDGSLSHGRTETDQQQLGDLLDDRLRAALGPSFRDAAGIAVCGTPEAPIAGCVPMNLFGGPGSVTQEMLDYIGADLLDRGDNEQTVLSLNLHRDLARLPAGELVGAFGYEYREEKGSDRPDSQTVLGNTSGSARALTEGRFDSQELYAELGIPLLRDARFARSLELDVGGRWVDASNFDDQFVHELGLIYQPTRQWVLRAAHSEAFRAPNVRELFGGQTQSNPILSDPCADFGRLSPIEIERCVAQGVPADGSFDQNGNETPQLGGGNPELNAEQAEIFTLGVTWQPDWLEGLVVSLDLYDIEIDNAIGSLGATTILEQCLATGQDALCSRIERAEDGSVVQVRSELQNVARETAQGVDLEIEAGHELAGGRVQHGLLLSYVAERDLVAFPGAEPFVGAGGYDRDSFGAIPRWKGNYRIGWSRDDLEVGYSAEWIGGLNERGGELFPGTINPVGDALYHDLRMSYQALPQARITLGVDNLGDRQPPFLANADEANTDVGTYRLLGRTYWLRLEYRPQ